MTNLLNLSFQSGKRIPQTLRIPYILLLLILLTCCNYGISKPDAHWWPSEVEHAVSQGGTNGPQLTTFLESIPASQRDGAVFLLQHMPQRDLESLSADFLLENVSLAYRAFEAAPWKKSIPQEIFLNEILPYANLNEDRENWRRKLHDLALPLVKGCKTPSEAAHRLNQKLYPLLKVKYSTERRAPDQAPLETMQSGVATCTGLAILLVDACRSVGIPARIVGTPMWANNRGNHTWLEIWDGDWHFLGAAEPDPKGLDHGWFVNDASQAIKDDPKYAIYASSFKKTGLSFPLTWAPDLTYVNAVNITERYAKPRQQDAGKMRFLVKVLDRPVGKRVSATVTLSELANPSVQWKGTSKDESADLNDLLTFELPKQRTYLITTERDGQKKQQYFTTSPNPEETLVVYLDGVPVVNLPAQACRTLTAPIAPLPAKKEKQLKSEARSFFTASTNGQSVWKFSRNLESLLAGNEPAVRRAVWEAYLAAPIHESLQKDFVNNKVRFDDYVSPYTVKTVGTKPAAGWALFIAMHGGGGVPKEINDSQWQTMQRYYRDHPEVGGYLYVALRAPNDTWNGFYTDYAYPLISNLTRQFRLFGDVNPNKIFLMGYSHGGYGAFSIGPKMPDHFAAIHASAAAPADGAEPQTLRNTVFTYMVGEKDTNYGRIERCQKFNESIQQLRGERTDIFPVTLTVIANHPHSGLPDRDKIVEMYPAIRNPVSRELSWLMTDKVIHSFYWLQTPAPTAGTEIDAICRDNFVTVTTTNTAVNILLDGRLVDFRKPVTFKFNEITKKVKLTPSLRTLCQTMQQRGDPDLAFTIRIDLPEKNQITAE